MPNIIIITEKKCEIDEWCHKKIYSVVKNII